MTKYKYDAAVVGMGSLGTALHNRFNHEDVIDIRHDDNDYLRQILESKILLLCMKQPDILAWVDQYSVSLHDDQIMMSFGAALSLASLSSHTKNHHLAVGRAMTNKGIAHSPQHIVWTAKSDFNTEQKRLVDQLFGQIGYPHYVGVGQDSTIDKETHKACDMGRIAYILREYQGSLITGLGYSAQEATETVLQSLGAIMESLQSGERLDQIAQRVASPGGITEASIGAMSGQVTRVLNSGMQAANVKMMEINRKYI